MSLPSPNLDDRKWKDIVEEAKRMIPTLCPSWTDFNPSDPGITLMELMAWMTEMLLYRLNLVPDKNYIKFLEMVGITLTPPKPATAWLHFDVAPGAPPEKLPLIPAGAKVSGTDSTGKTIVFETKNPLNLNASRLVKLFSLIGERYTDNSSKVATAKPGKHFSLFKGNSEIPHIFFLGDTEFAEVGNDFSIRFHVEVERGSAPLNLQWSCWDGKQWVAIVPSSDTSRSFSKTGDIVFTRFPQMKLSEIQGYKALWLQIRLDGYEGTPLPIISKFQKCLELKREAGIMPDTGFFSSKELPYFPLVFQGVIMPFGNDGKVSDSFYVSSQIFSRKGVPITIEIQLADNYDAGNGDFVEQLKIDWEYYGKSGRWELLGRTSPLGVLESRWGFADHSESFTRSGKITFYVPEDIVSLKLHGEIRYWLRARIIEGNFNISKKKKNPPVCTGVLLFYTGKPENFQYYLTYNDFNYSNLTSKAHETQSFQLFNGVDRKNPEMYMGFDSPFTNKLHQMYFRLIRKGSKGSEVIWEYRTAEKWEELDLVLDETRHFTRRGLVSFIGPPDWVVSREFATRAFWIRVRWKKFKSHRPPQLRSIHLNTVKALNAVSHREEILGDSTGQPFQHFTFREHPIQPGPQILVRESDSRIEKEIQLFKESIEEEVVEEIDPDTGEVTALWVEWHQVENFFKSDRHSRHYMLDTYSGVITFGDGLKGKIPPIGSRNIKCGLYYTGGGFEGNLGKNTLTTLETAYPFINEVTNPYPAAGGTELETLEEAMLRAPWELKHRNRAVTAGDFRQLAKEASDQVAQAFCYTGTENNVKIVIIPQGSERKLVPSQMLCEMVKVYLEERRLLTSRVEVMGPDYTDFFLDLGVVLRKEVADEATRIKTTIETKLKKYFHPLSGGQNGNGWPMGRSVYLSEVAFVVETIAGVDHINMLALNGIPLTAKIEVTETGFPFITDVNITLKS